MIKASAVAALATAAVPARAQTSRKAATPGYRISNKRIRQSIMGWTFNPMPTEELIATCVDIGLTGIEGISPQFYPAARKAGLEISLVGSHGFAKGPNDPANRCSTRFICNNIFSLARSLFTGFKTSIFCQYINSIYSIY